MVDKRRAGARISGREHDSLAQQPFRGSEVAGGKVNLAQNHQRQHVVLNLPEK